MRLGFQRDGVILDEGGVAWWCLVGSWRIFMLVRCRGLGLMICKYMGLGMIMDENGMIIGEFGMIRCNLMFFAD